MSGEYSSPPCYAHEFETTDAQAVENAGNARATGGPPVASECASGSETASAARRAKRETMAEAIVPTDSR